MRLNPKKVLDEIGVIEGILKGCMDQKRSFRDIHLRTLWLCKEIFPTKKSYKIIDVSYPVAIQIVSEDNAKIINASPSAEDIWKQEMNLGRDILSILQEARKIFSLKLRIQDKS